MKLDYLKIDQPIGPFFLTAIDAATLAKIAVVERRFENPDAVQREQSEKRVKEIAEYCSDSDATFPTPIIIAVDEDANVSITDNHIIIDENNRLGEVIDGQHRLSGLKNSNYITKFKMPVVLMFNLYPEQKAYVFSIINSKQTRVNMSLIYDLFELSTKRSPYKTCHEIARALNKDPKSPLYNRLKMLGKKTEDQELASLSQGTFIKYLLELISKKPDEDTRRIKRGETLEDDKTLVLREYFIKEKDSVIYKIIFNLFSAVKKVFTDEWMQPDEYIISKSIGFGAVIKIFPELYKLGKSSKQLDLEFFTITFINIKEYITAQNKKLTSEYFGSNEQARTELSKIMIDGIGYRKIEK